MKEINYFCDKCYTKIEDTLWDSPANIYEMILWTGGGRVSDTKSVRRHYCKSCHKQFVKHLRIFDNELKLRTTEADDDKVS